MVKYSDERAARHRRAARDDQPTSRRSLGAIFEAGAADTLVGPPIDGSSSRAEAAARLLAAGVRVGRVASAVNLSERQLERGFASVTGLSPKRFGRIARLRRAVRAAKRGAPLVQAALVGGYADQAHFTREIKALTGRTPTQILPHVGNVQDLSPPAGASAARDGSANPP